MNKLAEGASKLGFVLDQHQLEQFELYYQELASWNERMNLTAIIAYQEVQLKHFLDSLTVLLALHPGDRISRVIDVGTGAGMPGLPLKIALPYLKLTLLEATAKKVAFLRHLVERLTLKEVEVITGRAEEVAHLPAYREQFDLVLSRAVAGLPTLAELTLPFCRLGGLLVAQKKGDIEEEIRRAGRAITLLGGRLTEVKEVSLTGLERRLLVVVDKVNYTPPLYPRRPGIPAKRPL